MAYSKDGNSVPDFISPDKVENMVMVSTEDAKITENILRGIKTPGWNFHKEVDKELGGTKRINEVVIAFSGKGNLNGGSGNPIDPEKPETPLEVDYVVPTSANILLNGHSLIDAILTGSADTRQTLTQLGNGKQYLKWTIPGSSLQIRWDSRHRSQAGEEADVAATFDFDVMGSPIIPSRDIDAFDAMIITESGPFAQIPNGDYTPEQFMISEDYFDRWLGLPTKVGFRTFFWTIWPGRDAGWSTIRNGDRTDLPVFKSYLDSYGKTAEAWCSPRNIKIIPGHVLWAELYDRAEAGTLGVTFEDLFADEIHPNHLGSIFNAITVYRWVHGVMPTDAQIQLLLDDGDYPVTVTTVKDVVTSTLTYVQGSGKFFDKEFTPPANVFFNFEVPLESQGFTEIGGDSILAGKNLDGTNWAYKELDGQPAGFYAVLDVQFVENSLGSVNGLVNFAEMGVGINERNTGLVYYGWSGSLYAGVTDGIENPVVTSRTYINRPWTESSRMKIEVISTRGKIYIRNLAAGTWSDQITSISTGYPENLTHFVIGGGMRNNTFVPLGTNFIIHKGVVLDYMPTQSERLGYQYWMNGSL